MFDATDKAEITDADPHKLVAILDYDEVCYRLTASQFGYFKTSFALTVMNTLPDFKAIIQAEDRGFFEQECYDIEQTDMSSEEKENAIRVKEAFYTAVAGWENHKDCTHYFTHLIEDEHKRDAMREDLDRMAHSILPTHLWEPIDGLAQQIKEMRELGAEVIIWTHGRREMVNRTLQQNGLDGLFTDAEIFDKQTLLDDGSALGRKDRGSQNYARLCKQLGVLPENCALVDDTKANHKSAAEAGIGARIWVDWPTEEKGTREKAIIDFPKVKVDDTAAGIGYVRDFLRQKNMEYGKTGDPANSNVPFNQGKAAAFRRAP